MPSTHQSETYRQGDTPMNTKTSLARLALAVADALEDQSTPSTMTDALNELASQLVDELSGGNSALELRALAQFMDSRTRPEVEKAFVAAPGAKNGHLNGASINSLS
jgi:hypothetical protein